MRMQSGGMLVLWECYVGVAALVKLFLSCFCFHFASLCQTPFVLCLADGVLVGCRYGLIVHV